MSWTIRAGRRRPGVFRSRRSRRSKPAPCSATPSRSLWPSPMSRIRKALISGGSSQFRTGATPGRKSTTVLVGHGSSSQVAPASLVMTPLLGSSPMRPKPKPKPKKPPTPPPVPAIAAPYTPAQVRHAYGIDQLGLTGAGQIIAIVDAYDDPTIASDLHHFDQAFGLPDPAFIKAVPRTGTPAFDAGWAGEIALDVEWAHAVAPGATILLVEAASSSFNDLLSAVDYAVASGAKQVLDELGRLRVLRPVELRLALQPPGRDLHRLVRRQRRGGELPGRLALGDVGRRHEPHPCRGRQPPERDGLERQRRRDHLGGVEAGLPVGIRQRVQPRGARRVVQRRPEHGLPRLRLIVGRLVVSGRRHERRGCRNGRAWSPWPTRAAPRWASLRWAPA